MVGHSRYITGPLGKHTRPKVIEFRHLTAVQSQQTILRDITLEIFEGESVAILGTSGAGKSALLACIQGQIQPARGELIVLGALLPPLRPAFQKQMGSMPKNIARHTQETVAEYFQRFAGYHMDHLNSEQIQTYCAHYQLSPAAPVSELNSLQQRVFALALALVHDPCLVLLDEPLAELTAEDQAEFWPYLQRTRREGRTLLCTFTPPLAENHFNEYDLVVSLEQGQIRQM
jgi:ABC-2 type transport system ATP-binding protein